MPGENISLSDMRQPRAARPPHGGSGPRLSMSGGVLLSRRASPAVPSALNGLTSGFGMGPGVSRSLWPPKLYGGVAADPVDSAVARTSGTAQWTRALPVQARK